MIVICDRNDSARARSLRERILSGGTPAAVSAPFSVKDLLPAAGIVVWQESFDELRHTPCDKVFAAVIGDGFVNTALNAARTDDETAALALLRRKIPDALGMPENGTAPFGFYLTPRLFFAEGFAEWRGRIIPLTATERRILLYLTSCARTVPASSAKIARFCSPDDRIGRAGEDNRIAAQICGINRKFMDAAGERVIREKRRVGYYASELL
ncbi:MAG: helix-turn-helix domain-containing protein [Ruminococcaceae bacterium]|jgi:hypothetical protein|nr:helix-turn-helix domain-containing protein [Oscillospiraceae bacterium]